MERWAINTSVEVRSRIHINSMEPQFAHFDARLEPSTGSHDGIRLVTNWTNESDNKWLNAIQQGVERFVDERNHLNRPVCNTTLVMVRMISHEIVTTEATVSRNVKNTLRYEFEDHESVIRGA